MNKKHFFSMASLIAIMLVAVLPALAAVPPPPANQTIGIDDTVFGNFTEDDCRLCHEDPEITEPTSIPDRHHLLYGTTIPAGAAAQGACSGPGPETCYVNFDCPTGETCNGGQVPDIDANNDGTTDTTFSCLNCHREDTTGGIITLEVWRDCMRCHNTSPHHQSAAAQSGDCVHCHGTLVDNPVGCKQLYCAVAASSAGATRGVPIVPCTIDGGNECDTLGLNGGPVRVCRDTTELCASNSDCQAGTCSVTTTTSCYANTDCPTGETCTGAQPCSSAAPQSRCGYYGGEDTCDDGHLIPTYAPSLVTPARGGHGHVCEGTTDLCQYDTDCAEGTCSTTTSQTCHDNLDCPSGETCNGGVVCIQETEEGAVGGCTYCHNADGDVGTIDPASGVLVRDNHDTHHGAGVHTGHSERCAWCHMAGYPHSVYGEKDEHIRWCENCHGYESLHNIAIDSATGCLFGDPGCEVVIGGELAGYSHVGNNDDCWGCHGFATAAAPGSGPATPYLLGSDTLGATTGYDTTINLIGAALTNLVGTYRWVSDVTMTGADGSAVTLAPASVTSNQLAVTIPAATAPGNYALRAVKGTSSASNPIVISVKPEVAITGSSCDRKKGVLTVSGSGFGVKPAGTDADINVQVNGQSVNVTSWSDTKITASVSSCSNNAAVTVNALMGSATSGGGKASRPCTGKKCN